MSRYVYNHSLFVICTVFVHTSAVHTSARERIWFSFKEFISFRRVYTRVYIRWRRKRIKRCRYRRHRDGVRTVCSRLTCRRRS